MLGTDGLTCIWTDSLRELFHTNILFCSFKGECLLTVTESNPPAIQTLKENADAFRCLQHLVQIQPSEEIGHENSDAKTLLVSVLAAGKTRHRQSGNLP